MENPSGDVSLMTSKKNMWLRIGGYLLASIFLVVLGVVGCWVYRGRIVGKLSSSENALRSVSGGDVLVEGPLDVEDIMDEQGVEFNSVRVFFDKYGDEGFYFLHKGKVYFDEPKEGYYLDVLDKEGWRELVMSKDTGDFGLFDISKHYQQVFFVTECQEGTCDLERYRVFSYDWEQPIGEKSQPVETYVSSKDVSYPVPRIDRVSKDGDYVSLHLYQCWACGGHDPKTVLISLDAGENKKLGFVRDFYWGEDGKYSFRKVIYEECSYPEDEECIPVIGNLKLIESELQQGQFGNVEYQEVVTMSD
jgi:hypothetical protein